jgi:ABC-type multidrug transport system fused ATPase/permease subunit
MGVNSSLSRGVTLEKEVLFALRERHDLLKKLTLGVVGCGAANALLALSAGAVAAGWGRTPFDHPVVPGNWSRWPSIEAASYVGLGSAIVKAALGTLVSASEKRLGAAVSGRFRTALVSRFLECGTGMPAPSALALIAVRLREIEHAVVEGIVGRARSIAQLVPLALCLVALAPGLALGAAVALAPFAAVLTLLRRRLRLATERAQSTVEVLESEVDELVRNVDLFRAYGAGERALLAIDRSASEAERRGARVDGAGALASGFNEVMAALAVVGVIALAGRFGLPTEGTALVPFVAVFFMGYRPLRDLGDAKGWIERGTVALEAIQTATNSRVRGGPRGGLHEAPHKDARNESNRDAGTKTHDVEHRPPDITLTDFGGAEHGALATFRVAPRQIVCIVGPTGCGKTTLLRCMLGLEQARGSLAVDGEDITNRAAGPGERPFAWVPQDAPLVTGTIVENVALFGKRERAPDALRLVGAERIAGADEIVGPGGRPLSGGERRLLSLARAFASELPVLLLDEPTEGLDADATHRVLDAVLRLRGQRSILVATHRAEVMAIADSVVHLGVEQRLAAE